jgi:hypothetical protein
MDLDGNDDGDGEKVARNRPIEIGLYYVERSQGCSRRGRARGQGANKHPGAEQQCPCLSAAKEMLLLQSRGREMRVEALAS